MIFTPDLIDGLHNPAFSQQRAFLHLSYGLHNGAADDDLHVTRGRINDADALGGPPPQYVPFASSVGMVARFGPLPPPDLGDRLLSGWDGFMIATFYLCE